MTISKKDFFTNNQVLFVGLSSDPKSFSRSVYKDFIKAGINVVPVNSKKFRVGNVDVYSGVEKVSQVPECAYVLLNTENTKDAVRSLKDSGVKKVLFHSNKTVDLNTLSECKAFGMETFVACPKMMISNGLIHKVHGFVAGIR